MTEVEQLERVCDRLERDIDRHITENRRLAAENEELKAALEDQEYATDRWIVEAQKLKVETIRLRDLCLRAAFYIGVRQGPELDQEADELMKQLRGET